MREISKKEIVRMCCGDAGRAFMGGIISSFLLIFYIPAEGVDAIHFIPMAALTLGIIKAIGTIWDAISDPLIASITDRSKHELGRRIPFMRKAFIPYVLCCLFVFFAPIQKESIINAIFVGVALLLFYTFSTLYYIPYSALQVEVVHNPKKRVFFYTINSLMYVICSAIAFTIYTFKALLTKAGFSYAWSYRIPFLVFGILALVLLAIPAFTIKEKELVGEETSIHVPLFESLKKTFKYKNFIIMVAGYLVMWVGLTFFNSTLAYYITVLLGFEESMATVVLSISIVLGVATYPLINKLCSKVGKRPLLIAACTAYVILFASIYFYKGIISVIPATVYVILLGVLVAMPISITNIIPASCFGDCAQYDYVLTNEKRTGMFVASKNFVMKLSDSIVVILVSLCISKGSIDGGSATVEGVRLTALIASLASLVAVIIYSLYNDKEMIKRINEENKKEGK